MEYIAVRHFGFQGYGHDRGRPVQFPEMQRPGADSGDLTAFLAANGAQTQTVLKGAFRKST